MVLRQHYLGCLAHASYLVADEAAGVAAVVDPQRDVDDYVDEARELGCRIAHVVLTHFHADFVAGHLELRDREGARIHLGARAAAEYDFAPLADGDVIELGDVRLEALETPGHSPESISLVVYAGDVQTPHAVLTGDTLFVGDVGRPDLRASLGWSAEQLGAMLYDSLHAKLLALPDETLVYPGHGAGSLCGKNLSTDTVSTIGVQRRYNYALAPMTREEFVDVVCAEQPETPAYFSYDAMLNTKERPTLEQERPIVVVAEPGREQEAAMRLGRIGFDTVAGHLDGGMQALTSRPDLVARIERITAAALAEQLDGPAPPLVVDVRTEREWSAERIEGSVNVPLAHLLERLGEVPRDRPLVVHCGSGYRSSIAASLLRRAGYERVSDLVGGIAAWTISARD